MSATWKFLLGRIGLFALVFVGLLPTGLHPLVVAMAALLASFLLSFVVLRKWRAEMLGRVDDSMRQRREHKERLRAALAGEDED